MVFVNACASSNERKTIVSKKAGLNEITVHELGNADKINPLNSTSASASNIELKKLSNLIRNRPYYL